MKMFAFWKYDSFPYILGGEMLRMEEDGLVQVKGFQGYRFKPIKLLPIKAGAALLAKLKALTAEHKTEMNALNEDFRVRARELFGEGAP